MGSPNRRTAFASAGEIPSAEEGLSDLSVSNVYDLDEQRSCGVRCCVFLDHYFGGTHSYSDVIRAAPVSMRGSNLEDIASTLRSFGHSVEGVRWPPSGLRLLRGPAVLAVRKGEIDHFVVALRYEAPEDSFVTFDPPRKLGKTTYESIAKNYRGYALLVSGPEEERRPFQFHVVGFIRLLLTTCGLVALLWIVARRYRAKRMRNVVCGLAVLIVPHILCLLGCGQISREAPSTRDPEPESVEQPARIGQSFTHDAGRVVRGSKLRVQFPIRNTTASSFDILDIRKSCTCQIVSAAKTAAILPDEEVRIEVEIDTKGTAGHFARDVVLVTNSTDPGLREIVLGTRGEVVGTVRADPSQLSFGAVDYGSIHHKTLRIEALDPKVLRTLSSVSCSDSHLSAAFTLINDESAELTVKGAFENMIDGDFFARIDLNFDHPEIKVLSIDVNGRVRSRVHVVPRVVVVSGRADSWSHSFRVQSLDDVEFNLVAVDAPDGVAAGWTPGRAKSFTIHLAPEEGRSRIPSGMHAVSIATDLEGAASVQVPLLVQLQP